MQGGLLPKAMIRDDPLHRLLQSALLTPEGSGNTGTETPVIANQFEIEDQVEACLGRRSEQHRNTSNVFMYAACCGRQKDHCSIPSDALTSAATAEMSPRTTSGPHMAKDADMAATWSGWRCQLCGSVMIPGLGRMAKAMHIGQGSRHHCRRCGRPVCGGCSFKSNDVRTCKDCHAQARMPQVSTFAGHAEKYLFLIRHAESVWNAALADGASSLVREMWDRDHPLTEVGADQAASLRQRMSDGFPSSPQEDSTDTKCFYDHFLASRELVYCSPLLRAVQTAHLAFSSLDGWGQIRLLKDAREHYNYVTERDCLGVATGDRLVDRAVKTDSRLEDLRSRIDVSDCMDRWWSDTPDRMLDLDARHRALWSRLLSEDPRSSRTLVTHSNLIRALLLRFGCGQHQSLEDFLVKQPEDAPSSPAGSGTLNQAMTAKLQNCGVIGVRCVFCDVDPRSAQQEGVDRM